MVALQNLRGAFIVVGPMCHWDMQVIDKIGHAGTPRTRTTCVTNSRVLANTLDVRCSNDLCTEPFRFHLHLFSGLAKQAAKYPPKLVKAFLKALKTQMARDIEINHVSMKFGGPDPTQELFDGEHEEEWIDEVFGGQDDYYDEDGRYYDEISGVELPKQVVMTARQKELDWVHGIKVDGKVPRQQATDKNIEPRRVPWVDIHSGDDGNMNTRRGLVGREQKAKTKEALLAHESFSAVPPWERTKTLLWTVSHRRCSRTHDH